MDAPRGQALRSDLPEPVKRRLAAERRKAAREIGRMFDELVEAGVDPRFFLRGVHSLFLQYRGDIDSQL